MRWFVIGCIAILSLAGCATGHEAPDNFEQVENEGQIPYDSAPGVARFDSKSRKYVIDWPVNQARLTQRFHIRGRKPHLGIDLAAPKGSKVFSAHYGTVVYTGNEFHGYGKLVIVEQSNSWATFYSHLDKIRVKEGQMIEQGQVVGLMGRTGNAHGVHLHFELRNHKDPVDPLLYLPNGSKI